MQDRERGRFGFRELGIRKCFGFRHSGFGIASADFGNSDFGIAQPLYTRSISAPYPLHIRSIGHGTDIQRVCVGYAAQMKGVRNNWRT
jgi:hypothetical protein